MPLFNLIRCLCLIDDPFGADAKLLAPALQVVGSWVHPGQIFEWTRDNCFGFKRLSVQNVKFMYVERP